MGLFGFGKKPSENPPERDEAARRWKDAYRVNPAVYQNRDKGTFLGNCTLTEDTDSLLPLHPENQWAADGKPIQNWILSIVSLTEDRVLGQIAYQEAMGRLRRFSLAESEGWILIRAMTHAELDGLFEGLPRKLV